LFRGDRIPLYFFSGEVSESKTEATASDVPTPLPGKKAYIPPYTPKSNNKPESTLTSPSGLRIPSAASYSLGRAGATGAGPSKAKRARGKKGSDDEMDGESSS